MRVFTSICKALEDLQGVCGSSARRVLVLATLLMSCTVQCSSSSSSDPKGVRPQDRLKKFPNEQLSVSAGKSSCNACREN